MRKIPNIEEAEIIKEGRSIKREESQPCKANKDMVKKMNKDDIRSSITSA